MKFRKGDVVYAEDKGTFPRQQTTIIRVQKFPVEGYFCYPVSRYNEYGDEGVEFFFFESEITPITKLDRELK